MTLEEVASRFQGVRQLQRGGYEMLCPCHDDRRPSLGIAIGENGGVLMHCLAGCANADILAAVGLTLRDLAPTTTNGHHPPETVYRYDDEHGEPLFEVVRTWDKRFWQRLPGGAKGKITRRVLYRLPGLLRADRAAPVFIVEGEKDADNLWRHHLPATTNPMGAGKWRQEYTDWLVAYLPERRFIILPDNDEPGLNHADQVEHSLRGAGLSVQTRQLPGLPPKGDVSDWLETGGAAEDLVGSALGSPKSAAPWSTAPVLLAKELAPLEWVVPGVIPEGLTIFGGRPKQGKSWGIYGVGLAVASGGRAFGKIAVPQGEVLYLALEDGERRLQARMLSLLKGEPAPEAFSWAITWPKLGMPGQIATPESPDCLSYMQWWLDEHPAARVIIVDTFARIKNKPTKGANSYDEDTEVMAPLHRLAVERRVGLVLVTHTRKPPTGRSQSEFLDEIQGSTGITGVADTILGLRKTGDQQVSLFVRGRDVDEQELLIQWDADTSDWTLLGNAEHVRLTDLQAEILAALPADGSPIHYRQVARDVGKTGRGGHEATRIILRRLSDRGVVKQLQDGFFSLALQQ